MEENVFTFPQNILDFVEQAAKPARRLGDGDAHIHDRKVLLTKLSQCHLPWQFRHAQPAKLVLLDQANHQADTLRLNR
ncbi:hypothetical protein [Rhabdaerophilum sp.]|uniref:hypothetical protein n=1 Tax=Rhabdaerophilum sp. TaxID=2717341 RepID=UPI0038D3D4EA